jgi:hypothetical protein
MMTRCVSLLGLAVLLVVTGCGDDSGGGSNEGDDYTGNNSAAGEIGEAGGRVELNDGAKLAVPEGALPESTTVSVQRVPVSEVPLPNGLSLVSEAYAFEPHGTEFDEAVTLTLPYDASATGAVVLKLDDESDETWEEVDDASFDDGVATVRTRSFSIYGVGATDQGGGDDDAGADPIDAATDNGGGSGGSGGSSASVDCESSCEELIDVGCENGPMAGGCTEWCAEQAVTYDQILAGPCADEFTAYTDCLNADIAANYGCDAEGRPEAADGLCPDLAAAWDDCYMNGG